MPFESLALPILLSVIAFALTLLALLRWQQNMYGWRKPAHRRRECQARRHLETLTGIQEPGQKFSYLRKINPFTFEELLLECFERRGYRIQRNTRYTGDGGIDGRVWINGDLFLIQAKRYAGHINPAHIRDFSQLVNAKGCKGFFIHTGKTGHSSRAISNQSENVHVISGQRLLDLLQNESQV